MVGELSVGPPSGVDPAGQMRVRIQNKQTNIVRHTHLCLQVNYFSDLQPLPPVMTATALCINLMYVMLLRSGRGRHQM